MPVDRSLFFWLLPYIEQETLFKEVLRGASTTNRLVKTYISPADFTSDGSVGECSYAANVQFFNRRPPTATAVPLGNLSFAAIPRSLPDGTTNTILFGEIYQICAVNATGDIRLWANVMTHPQGTDAANNGVPILNKASAGNNVNPINLATLTGEPIFQTQPKSGVSLANGGCNATLAQTPHPGGMLVGLGDASVRSIQPSLHDDTWRKALTPADGLIFIERDW
jgi:hypothetical protein